MAYPRITFHAPGRTFDRLLKESSLSDLKETVRKKLGLGSGSVVQFSQLRDGQLVDLEDEDDFDAFCAVATDQRHATVQVVLTENSVAEGSNVDAKGTTSPRPPTPASAVPGYGRLNINSSTSDPGAAVSRQKVVLKNEDGIEVNLEAPMIKNSQTHPPPSVAPPSRLDSVRPLEDLAKEDGSTQEPEEGELHPSKDDAKERSREALRMNTALSEKRRPGPLDLSNTRPPPSLLALVRPLGNLDSITYPEGIRRPKPELNIGAKEGKFRYDRDFLMQFMSICKEKPNSLPPLDSIGLAPVDPLSLTRGGSGSHRQPLGTSAPSWQASVGGRLPGATLRGQFQSMGSFTTTPSKFGQSERLESASNRSVYLSGPIMPFPNTPLQMIEDQDIEPTPSHRTRSKRGEKKSEANKAAAVGSQAPNLEPVASLLVTEDKWDRKSFSNNDSDSPEVVDTNVKDLLTKLPTEEFDSISDQIIQWANRSERRKDGRILIQVTRLVFEKAIDDAPWSGIYARLCRKMADQISPKVQDESIKNFEGKPITGGQLFCKYLLSRCHEDFEHGWSVKEVTTSTAATKAAEDQSAKVANERGESGEIIVDSDENYAAQKSRRQGLGLTKFIGELFKRQILTERIMHECIKKLLANRENPSEEDIESLCMLLTTIGSLLDTRKARAHVDVYFQRMQEIGRNVSPRMQSLVHDVIELRKRHWQPRKAVVVPTTIPQVHEAAAEEKADKEKEAIQRLGVSCGGSRLGGTRDDYPQTDGWNSISRAIPRAGDLSSFGKISKAQPPTTSGPSSVFASKRDNLKHEPALRTNSGSNMFSALQEVQQEPNQAAEHPPQRKKRLLQPRNKPAEEAPFSMLTNEAADAKIFEDVQEFFSIRNLDEAEVYFIALPSQYHHRLVNKLVSSAVESKEADAMLVSDLFRRVNSKGLCSSDAFEEGLAPTAEIIEDIAIDAPKAWSLFATMVKGAQSNEDHRTRLASKTADSDKLLGLLSDVIGLRASKWQARNAIATTIAQAPEAL